jgi:two-component system phosphate regulon response regulator PhoB
MSKSILLIHPEAALRKDVRTLLAGQGFILAEASELHLIDIGSPDAVVVDWKLLKPIEDSLRWLRQGTAEHPARVIILADRNNYSAAVRALESGADDCVGLPLEGDELLVRLNACLGRPQTVPAEERLTAGPIVLDRRVHKVLVHDESVDLAPTEFRLLAFLLENQGRVFSRNELLTRAWSRNVKAGHRTVDVHVRRLRQQLEPYRCAEMIQTVRGFGYRLRADESSLHAG